MSNNKKIKPSLFARLNRLIFVSTSFVCPLAQSEVTLDGSVGPAAALKGPDFQITENLGTRAGNNLFHSFGRFNLNRSQSATFSGSAGVNNVIGRVTGGQASTINGTLRVSIPNANLYLLNPAGVIFGEHATLDVSGSFHASTANYLKLQDGVRFDSGTATAPPVLSTAAPEAFGFLGENPAGILLTGTTDSALKAQNGSTISLIGGDITSESTAIYVPGGQINLASVGSAGEVVLNESGIQTTSFEQMGTISLSQDPLIPRIASGTDRVLGNVDVSSDTGGKVSIRGGQLVMDNAYIFSDTTSGNGRGISVGLTNDLNLSAPEATSSERPTGSLITSSTAGKGNAGNINLDVAQLKLTERAQINTRAVDNSTGNAGNLTINATSIQLQNLPDVVTLLTTASLGNGNAGNIAINTDTLEVLGGSIIDSTTAGKGSGGSLAIDAEKILLSGETSAFYTSSLAESTGNAGDLSVNAETMEVSDGAVIQSVTSGSGNGGNLTVNADNLEVNNGAKIDNSVYGSGNGGDLMISSSNLEVSDDANIDNSIYGSGNSGDLMVTATDLNILNSGAIQSNVKTETTSKGGNLTIDADTISLSGNDTAISSEAIGKGDSGNLTINSDKLELRNGAEISSSSSAQGNSGDLFVKSDEILLTNDKSALDDFEESLKELAPLLLGTGIHADLRGDSTTGNSGNLTIKSQNLIANNGASITADNFGQRNSGNIFVEATNRILLTNDSDFAPLASSTGIHANLSGDNATGNSGNTIIKSQNLIAKNGASITANNFAQGNSGDLFVESNKILLTNDFDVGRNSGGISATIGVDKSGNSGNLTVKSDNLVVKNGTAINTSNFGTGISGNHVVDAKSILLSGDGAVLPAGIINAAGNTGSIGELTIISDSLEIQNGAVINAGTTGESDGGNLNVNSRSIILSGNGRESVTGISTSALPNSTGNAGDITINTNFLQVGDGADITANTHGTKDAGELTIKADQLEIYNSSSIATTSAGLSSGNAGTLTISGNMSTNADHLEISDNSFITTATLGSGKGGNLNINASKIEIVDNSFLGTPTGGMGSAGDLTLVADDILVSNHSFILTAAGFGDFDNSSSDPEIARSGNIDITLDGTLRLENESRVTTVTTNANAGNITINNGKLIHLSNESAIQTRVLNNQGTGGNILISTPVVALDNSVIGAQAAKGAGGNINISGFLLQSPNSLVTASSEKGVDGEITLQPVTNINASIAVLPDTFMDTSQHLSERCVARSEKNLSSFVVKGRGVLPITPDDMAPSNYFNDLKTGENLLQDNESKVDTDHHSLDNIDNLLYSSLEKKYQSQAQAMNNDCNP